MAWPTLCERARSTSSSLVKSEAQSRSMTKPVATTSGLFRHGPGRYPATTAPRRSEAIDHRHARAIESAHRFEGV